ncbi:pilus assembly protein [Erythrobacter sp. LQ02-29]|uniref:TadE/TadG family type IV pilus assembly protein n=1 Tax=Erythrobacter sp. LQ02-29 TaxID=2920384 RepID=UPI001F4E013A|nr:pilus assembly protein [Erythrobacter sp. LQ02-29]
MIAPAAFLSRLRRATGGVAYIEFALGLPVFLTLILGGIETTNYTIAQLRTSQIAMSVADNAGRNPESVDEADIYEVFAGVPAIGGSLDFENNGRVVVSSLQDNGKTGSRKGQEIEWQRCYGDLDVDPAYGRQGAGANDDRLKDGMGAPSHRIAAGPGTAVIFVEATYEYQPLFWDRVISNPIIRYESAFNVRDRTENAITNTQNLTPLTC